MNHPVNPLLAKKRSAGLPCISFGRIFYATSRAGVIGEVNDDHAIVGNRRKEGGDRFQIPELGLIPEEPPLHDPSGLRITGKNALIHGAGEASQIFIAAVATYGSVHFIKCICEEIICSTKNFLILPYEPAPDLA